jgi:hypothetical protein
MTPVSIESSPEGLSDGAVKSVSALCRTCEGLGRESAIGQTFESPTKAQLGSLKNQAVKHDKFAHKGKGDVVVTLTGEQAI